MSHAYLHLQRKISQGTESKLEIGGLDIGCEKHPALLDQQG